jgi:hypothetical protein
LKDGKSFTKVLEMLSNAKETGGWVDHVVDHMSTAWRDPICSIHSLCGGREEVDAVD